MRRAITCLAILLFCVPLYGADYYHLWDQVTTKSGYAVSGASVNVYNPNTVVNPTAYTDLAGDTPVSWPLTTDSGGMFECYLADGNYDINIVHSGWDISTTWDNYMVGAAATIDSLGVAHIDTLKGATDDTVHVRGSDGGREGVLKTNQLVLEGAYGHGAADRAAIRFGPYAEGTENIHARVYLPYYGVFWMTRPGYSARVPKYDPGNASFGSHNMLGIGGTTGRTTNWQFWEDVFMAWAVADAESTASDTLNTRYNDRTVFGFGRKTTDAAYSGVDTMFCDAYQSFNISNDRADSASWCWTKPGLQGTVPNPVGDRGGPYGAPDYGIRLQTDLPDSNGVNAYRDAFQLRWWMTPPARRINNAYSSFLTMYEHDTAHYRFRRDVFDIVTRDDGNEKALVIHDSGSGFTTIKNAADASTLFYPNNGELDLYYMGTGGDSARIDANRAIIDWLTLGELTGPLPSTAVADNYGSGTALYRDINTANAGTLFIWDSADDKWHYFISDGELP